MVRASQAVLGDLQQRQRRLLSSNKHGVCHAAKDMSRWGMRLQAARLGAHATGDAHLGVQVTLRLCHTRLAVRAIQAVLGDLQ